MKKRKINYTRLKTFIVILSVILFFICLIVFNWTKIQLGFKGYGKEERNILLTLTDEEINEYLSYDEIIDISSWNSLKNNHHYYDYELLKKTIKDKKQIVKIVDTVYKEYYSYLTENGYDLKIIRSLMKKLDVKEFSILKDEKLSWSDIQPFININGCIVEDIPLYIKSELSPVEAIMSISYGMINSSNQVNINRKYSLDDPSNTQLLIKKGFYVPDTYVPENLVTVNIPNAPANENNMMRKDAANALEKMAKDASQNGLILAVNSAYRSYEEQIEIYNEYFVIYDPITASKLVAVPGCSEHQLGLSVDLTSQSVIDGQVSVFGDTAEYQWVKKNAHKYGFILRYPGDKTSITGTANEPWHFRYVGVELATKLYNENLTLEEYTLKNGFSYPVSIKQ